MSLMKDLFSPANLIMVTGGTLTVIGIFSYLTGGVNLSVPTLFYGFPIFLAGLALKTTELAPVKKIEPTSSVSKARETGPKELIKLLKDVTRWRYGQHVHLETSLQTLKLWDDANPPQLTEIEEIEENGGYGMRMRFSLGGVPLQKWEEKQERLGRFFAKQLRAELISPNDSELDLIILPNQDD